MGACYEYRTYDSKFNNNELLKIVQADCDEARWESGHGGYSGTWAEKNGAVIANKVFNSFDEAYDWVSDNNDKWGPLVAVKYLDGEAFQNKNAKKIEQIKSKIRDLEVLLGIGFHGRRNESFEHQVVERIKSGKSKTKTCVSCESKVATQYLNAASCPVCRAKHVFFTDSDHKKFNAATDKLEKLKKDLTALEESGKVQPTLTKDNWRWFVGGFCSE